jgi:hypothetical protein
MATAIATATVTAALTPAGRRPVNSGVRAATASDQTRVRDAKIEEPNNQGLLGK